MSGLKVRQAAVGASGAAALQRASAPPVTRLAYGSGLCLAASARSGGGADVAAAVDRGLNCACDRLIAGDYSQNCSTSAGPRWTFTPTTGALESEPPVHTGPLSEFPTARSVTEIVKFLDVCGDRFCRPTKINLDMGVVRAEAESLLREILGDKTVDFINSPSPMGLPPLEILAGYTLEAYGCVPFNIAGPPKEPKSVPTEAMVPLFLLRPSAAMLPKHKPEQTLLDRWRATLHDTFGLQRLIEKKALSSTVLPDISIPKEHGGNELLTSALTSLREQTSKEYHSTVELFLNASKQEGRFRAFLEEQFQSKKGRQNVILLLRATASPAPPQSPAGAGDSFANATEAQADAEDAVGTMHKKNRRARAPLV